MKYIVYKNTPRYRRVYVDTFTVRVDAEVYVDIHNRVIGDLATFYVEEEQP